ncbi:MAG: hypothetical protein WD557_08755 [Dehalococcoidia bacterium]
MEPEAALWLAVDVIGSLALLAGACFALGTAWVRPRRVRPFWIGSAAGLVYLAADERFSLHERIGRALTTEGVPDPPLVNHMDDAVLLAIVAAGILFLIVFAREVLRSPAFAALLALAAGATAAALAIDGFAPVEGWAPRTEEPLELLGQGLLLAAFARRWLELGNPLPAMPPRLRSARAPASTALPGDVAAVLDDVPHGHALDHESERPGHAAS